MADFGEIISDRRIAWYVEDPATQLSKLGGPGGTNAVIGTNDTPVVLLNAPAQILSGRIVAPVDWDTTVDCIGVAGIATATAVNNGDSVTLDVGYTYVQAGTAAGADFNKAETTISGTETFTTAEGLAVDTLYLLAVSLDRNDATNPYVGALPGGGFTFQININAASDQTSIYIVSIGVSFPVDGLDTGPLPSS